VLYVKIVSDFSGIASGENKYVSRKVTNIDMPTLSTRLEENAAHITNATNYEISSTTKAHYVKT